MKAYFRKRQSSELRVGLESMLRLRVLSLLLRLVSETTGFSLRNGVVGASPTPAWKHWGGSLSANWRPGVNEGVCGSLNLKCPIFIKDKLLLIWKEAGGQIPTRWWCGISYSKELCNGRVADWIQRRNSLVPCIWKVNNWSDRGDCPSEETTDIKNEVDESFGGSHLNFSQRNFEKDSTLGLSLVFFILNGKFLGRIRRTE